MWISILIITLMVPIGLNLYIKLLSKLVVNTHNPLLHGKIIIVTGGTSGIGRECVQQFCKLQAEFIIFTGRNRTSADTLIAKMKELYPKTNLLFKAVDFSDLNEVKLFSYFIQEEFSRIDILLNNAAAIFQKRSLTKQGFESSQGVNHIAVQYLTGLLYPLLKRTKDSRVVTTSSFNHTHLGINGLPDFEDYNFDKKKYGFLGFRAYKMSKVQNILFSKGLKIFDDINKSKYLNKKLLCVCVTPRPSDTLIVREIIQKSPQFVLRLVRFFMCTPWEGAQASLFCCLAPQSELTSGAYYEKCKPQDPLQQCKETELIKKLWNFTNSSIVNVMGTNDGYKFTDI